MLKYLPLLLFLLTMACKQKDVISIDCHPEALSPYLHSYTAGLISSAADVKVKFMAPMTDTANIGKEANKSLLQLSPSVDGTLRWEDTQTLVFEPAKALPQDTRFEVSLDMGNLIKGLPGDMQTVNFEFRTRPQEYIVQMDGIEAAELSNWRKQIIRGVVQTADIAAEADIAGTLEATQGGNTLPVSWTHSPDQLTHQFTISGVWRGEQANEVTVSWNAKALGIKTKGQQLVSVPALSSFQIMNIRVVQEEEQYMLLHFSDPLSTTQRLDGKLWLYELAQDVQTTYNGSLRYVVDGNQLRVYPSGRLSGPFSLQVNASVENARGKSLSKETRWALEFQDPSPAVRLVGNGVIIPETDGVLFPFEAISLNAVEVEIFKIFNNNILQYLQTAELDENSIFMNQVGRVVLRKRIELNNPRTADWTRYAFDLSELIEEDPKALYQVRIGFRRTDAAWSCAGGASETAGMVQAVSEPVEEDYSMMSAWYGMDGYYEDYTWTDRNDPCKGAYYNSDRFIQRNVLVSNIGLIAKLGNDQSLTLSVTDLRTAAPLSGATFEVYDYQNQLLARGSTDNQGMAGLTVKGKPYVVVASKNNQASFVRIPDGNSLSLSRFDVSGTTPQKGLKGFLYADRGVWRPGDSIYLNFILGDREKKLPPNYPIELEVFDARGQLYLKKASAYQVNNLYPLHFRTSQTDATGNWIARVKVGGVSFDKVLKIETIRPNRLKISLSANNRSALSGTNKQSFNLIADWLHGAPAKGLKAVVDMSLVPAKVPFSGFAEVDFNDPTYVHDKESKTVMDKPLDEEGNASFDVQLSPAGNAPAFMQAQFKTRVFEKGGEFSTDLYQLPYQPYPVIVGVRIPKDRFNEKRLELNKYQRISFVSITAAGKPAAGRTLNMGIYKAGADWWYEVGDDNVSRFTNAENLKPVARKQLISGADGKVFHDLMLDSWGKYFVRICDEESGHCAGSFFYAGNAWDQEGQREADVMLAVKTDKEKYMVGQEVTLSFPGSREGRALISIENSRKVIKSSWMDTRSGNNTYTFKVSEAMTPTVYAHVTYIQAHHQMDNDLPIRMYGVVPIAVEDPATRLHPEVQVAETLKPDSETTITVAEKSGREMTYTIAVVDEGLLDLTRHKTPDPWETFFAREALGVKTWDIYDMVLGAFTAEMGRILGVGGDAANLTGAMPNAMRFKPVVIHLGPFTLKKGGKASHKIRIPNYVGSVRTMVVASNGSAYGHTEKTSKVKKPLMVLATAPRILSQGERINIPVNVFAMEKQVREVRISIRDKAGLVSFNGQDTKTLNFSRPGDAMVNFDLETKQQSGVVRLVVTAVSGQERASHEIEVQLRNPNPYISTVYASVISPGKTWDQAYELPGSAGSNTGILEISTVPPLNLEKHLKYLIEYPYGCLEQTLSAGFPQLYVASMAELDENRLATVDKNIKATIARLRKFQTANGGFAYWPGQTNPDEWTSSYAGHFLLEAKRAGHTLPPGMLENWIKFQRKAARLWDPRLAAYGLANQGSYELSQAYRLYTLALSKSADGSAMNRLLEIPDLSVQARWMLAAAFASNGKMEAARDMIRKLRKIPVAYNEMSYTFGSDLRDRAIMLEVLMLTGQEEAAKDMATAISDALTSNQYHSTQTLGWALMTMAKYAGETGSDKGVQAIYRVGGQAEQRIAVKRPMYQVPIPVREKNKQLSLRNTGQGKLFARIIMRGQPSVGETGKYAESNLQLTVKYVGKDGKTVDIREIDQGTDFYALVNVRHPAKRMIPYRELALSQIFPSGWEIINTRMDGEGWQTDLSTADYTDVRDDRVHHFFDLNEGESRQFVVHLNAAYTGRFFMPPTICEAMYDQGISARTPGQWVRVIE